MWNRLVEPMGLLYGPDARAAIQHGTGLPLMGGPVAFTMARLIDGTHTSAPMRVEDIPGPWQGVLLRLTRAAPPAHLPDGPQVMGILNVTPDSFSNGGQHFGVAQALGAARAMADAGCRVLDIGGESTRPGAATVTPEQEWDRVGPVLEALRQNLPAVALSVDTRNSLVMDRALAAGADVINDVTALQHDPQALPLLAERHCGVVLMHMRGTPQTMDTHTEYTDVACDVVRELGQRVNAALAAGISHDRLMVDPGFGFAKTHEQNVTLLRRRLLLANLGCRVLFGLSRKRMIGAMTGEPRAEARDPGTQAATLEAMPLGAAVLRVHDVPGMVQSMRLWQALHTPAGTEDA